MFYVGLLDKLTKAVKVAAEKTKEALDEAQRKYKYRKEKERLKRVLLSRFTVPQLEQVAQRYGVSLRVVTDYDPWTGKVRTRRLRSKESIIKKLASELSYDDVLDAARRFKIPYKDIEEEREEIYRELFPEKVSVRPKTEKYRSTERVRTQYAAQPVVKMSKAVYVARVIRQFPCQPVRDEQELIHSLTAYLSGRLRDSVESEVLVQGGKADIVVGDECLIEVKIAKNTSELDRLLGQVERYIANGYRDIVVVIYDIGRNVNLEFYTNSLKRRGVQVVVLKGTLRKRRRGKRIKIEIS